MWIKLKLMIKIPTLFKKDPNDLSRVINEINPGCEWVYITPGVIPTRKFDGTAAAVTRGELYKRYDVKKGRQVPEGAIPCQEPDEVTGHWPHWVKVTEQDKYFLEAFNPSLPDGTYELCGPKVNGNKENFSQHILVKHGSEILKWYDFSFCGIKNFLENVDIEGIVFHHPDGRMCKIRKKDFGIKR